MSMKNQMHVAIRKRPLNRREQATLKDERLSRFKHVYNATDSTQRIFDSWVRPQLVEQIGNGKSVTIWVYGRSGTGESFTIFGNAESSGILQMVMGFLEAEIRPDSQITVSFVEMMPKMGSGSTTKDLFLDVALIGRNEPSEEEFSSAKRRQTC